MAQSDSFRFGENSAEKPFCAIGRDKNPIASPNKTSARGYRK
jgi:hypothetical protein